MINPDELKVSILNYVEDNDEAKNMPFAELYENINRIHPCESSELAIVLSLMDKLNTIRILRDSAGRGLGFMLPEHKIKPLSDSWETP